MSKELYYKFYTWGIRKEGQTLSELECEQLKQIALEFSKQENKELYNSLNTVIDNLADELADKHIENNKLREELRKEKRGNGN